jgi:hypothetical protein
LQPEPFKSTFATAGDGRITLMVVVRDRTGALRSEIDATIATDDLTLLAQPATGGSGPRCSHPRPARATRRDRTRPHGPADSHVTIANRRPG